MVEYEFSKLGTGVRFSSPAQIVTKFVMRKQKFFDQAAKFSLIVLITITLTRIVAVSFFYFLRDDGQIVQSVISDPIHHYHFGLALIILGIILRKYGKATFLAAIGLGIFLEEWIVFIRDLGLSTNILYLTKIDFIVITGFVGLIYLYSNNLSIKMRRINKYE